MPRKVSHATMVRRRDKSREVRNWWDAYVISKLNHGLCSSWYLKSEDEYRDFHYQVRKACHRLDLSCKTHPASTHRFKDCIYVDIKFKTEKVN